MRIVFLTYEVIDSGGCFYRSFSLATALARKDKVFLFCGASRISFISKKYIRNSVKIIECPGIFPKKLRNAGLDPLDILFRIFFLLRNNFDVVHCFGHRPSSSFPCLLRKWIQKKSFFADWSDLWGRGGISDYRGIFFRKFFQIFDTWLEKVVYLQAKHVTAISTTLKKFLTKQGKKRSEVHLLRVGVSDDIKPLSKKKMRVRYKIDTDSYVISYLGHAATDEKYLKDIIIHLLQREKKIHFLHIGKPMYYLQEKIQKIHLSNRCTFTNFVSRHKVQEYLACSDIMLLPMQNILINKARYPNKLGDYIASKKPIIVSKVGDITELCDNHTIIGVPYLYNADKFSTFVLGFIKNVLCKKQNKKSPFLKLQSWRSLSKELKRIYLS